MVRGDIMVMQRTRNNINNRAFQGGQYARTQQELYKKAIELLDRCKIEARRQGDMLAAVVAAEEREECGASVIVPDEGVHTNGGVLCPRLWRIARLGFVLGELSYELP